MEFLKNKKKHRLARVAPVEEEEGGAMGEVEGNISCEKEKEKENEEEEKEKTNEEEEKEKDKKNEEGEKEKEIEEGEEEANGGGEESEGEVFLLENLGYRGYREDVLKDRLDPHLFIII